MKTYRLQRRFFESIVEDMRCFAVGNVVRGVCSLCWVGILRGFLAYVAFGEIASNVPDVDSAHDVVVSFARDVAGGLVQYQSEVCDFLSGGLQHV